MEKLGVSLRWRLSGRPALKRRIMAILAACFVTLGFPVAEVAAPMVPEQHTLPFFAFCMDTHDSQERTLEEQAALLEELGYDGAGHLWLDELAERIATLDRHGLRLFQVALRVNIAPDTIPYDPRLEEILALVKDRDAMLALLISGGPPSDPGGDARAVELVREIAGLAAGAGVRVVLYPHSGDWLERVEDALRIVDKAECPNVGVMFNLCHWLKVSGEEDLEPLLTRAMPRLFAVSIHGADRAPEIRAGTGNWIQPLDSGSFDVDALLDLLQDLGYRGPVGLQCYGIPGDARGHLRRSMAAWRRYTVGREARTSGANPARPGPRSR